MKQFYMQLQKTIKEVISAMKSVEKMNWKPKYDNLELICQNSYIWKLNEIHFFSNTKKMRDIL